MYTLRDCSLAFFSSPVPMTFDNFLSLFEFITSPLMAVYFLCAVFGGVLIVLQLLLMLVGFGWDTDDAGGLGDGDDRIFPTEISKVLSFRTIIAGVTFFGLGGLAALTGEATQWVSVIVAIVCGFTAIFAVYYLYWSVARMTADGTLSEKTLLGSTGSVYIRIPPAKSGTGKVQVSQQGRTAEYEAMTAGDELKTGTPIVVVGIVSATIVDVVAVTS